MSIQPWFTEALLPKEQAMSGAVNMGFAKIAFSYGLRVLNYLADGREQRTDERMYFEWMRWIIKRAGDTDTNGAIAGGLMGSVVGFWGLPLKYVLRTLMTVTDGRDSKAVDELEKHPAIRKSKHQAPRRPSFF